MALKSSMRRGPVNFHSPVGKALLGREYRILGRVPRTRINPKKLIPQYIRLLGEAAKRPEGAKRRYSLLPETTKKTISEAATEKPAQKTGEKVAVAKAGAGAAKPNAALHPAGKLSPYVAKLVSRLPEEMRAKVLQRNFLVTQPLVNAMDFYLNIKRRLKEEPNSPIIEEAARLLKTMIEEIDKVGLVSPETRGSFERFRFNNGA
ncbi:MAG TPA: hypothetical protein VFF09_04940 [archaeon]|nr:hypothetical protein [archaeon]